MEKRDEKLFKLSLMISRVLCKNASDKEWRVVEEWVNTSKEKQQLFERLKEKKELARKIKIYQKIDKNAAFNEFLQEKVKIEKRKKSIRFRQILGYAASLVFPLLLGIYLLNFLQSEDRKIEPITPVTYGEHKAILFLSDGNSVMLDQVYTNLYEQNGILIESKDSGLVYQQTTNDVQELIYNTLEVPVKGEFHMQLADGSKVWMGACSRLKYPVSFSGKTREVYLEGEAFFDVAKDPERPFIVKTKDFSVKALGTSFNVMNYPDDDFSHTTLKTGKVEVDAGIQKVILMPGTQMFYENEYIEVKEVDVDVYTAWMGDVFKFDKENIDVILRKLARWYDVHIFYTSESLKNYHFKGTLPKYTDIQDVLGLLEQTTDIKFEIKGNTVIVKKDLTRSDR